MGLHCLDSLPLGLHLLIFHLLKSIVGFILDVLACRCFITLVAMAKSFHMAYADALPSKISLDVTLISPFNAVAHSSKAFICFSKF